MKFTCGLCGESNGDPSDDHIIPQGLGRFDGALVTRKVCKRCNNEMGRTIEHDLLRKSPYAIVRANLGIQGKKSRKKNGFRDPLAVSSNSGGQKYATVQFDWENLELESKKMKRSGVFERPDSLVFEPLDNSGPSYLSIDGMNEPDVIEIIKSKFNEAKGFVNILHHDDYFVENVLKQLSAHGAIITDVMKEDENECVINGEISGEFDETHLRAHAFILLKLLLKSGFIYSDLACLSEFTLSGPPDLKCTAEWLNVGNFSQAGPMRQKQFGHKICWRVDEALFIEGVVGIFVTNESGLYARFRFPLTGDQIVTQLIGSYVAGYYSGEHAGHGWCEYIVSDKIISTTRTDDLMGNH